MLNQRTRLSCRRVEGSSLIAIRQILEHGARFPEDEPVIVDDRREAVRVQAPEGRIGRPQFLHRIAIDQLVPPALMAAFTELSETAVIAQATRLRLDAATGVLEQQLALAGHGALGDYSIADIALGCTAAALFLIGWPLQGRTALLNWISRLAARPGWQEEVIQNDIETARQAGYNI